MYIEGDFTQIVGQHCLTRNWPWQRLTNYTTLESSLLACAEDKKCIAVEDEGCDNAGEFRFCFEAIRSSNHEEDEIDMCVYRKSEGHGKYMKSIYDQFYLYILH